MIMSIFMAVHINHNIDSTGSNSGDSGCWLIFKLSLLLTLPVNDHICFPFLRITGSFV